MSASTKFLKHGATSKSKEVEGGQFAHRIGPVKSHGSLTQLQQFHGSVGLNNWLNQWIMVSLILGHLSPKA